MALEHRELPIAAVQFHPESLLTQESGLGQAIIERAVTLAPVRAREKVVRTVVA
jgi:anthranilate/para-aminobenzoate synthase component II